MMNVTLHSAVMMKDDVTQEVLDAIDGKKSITKPKEDGRKYPDKELSKDEEIKKAEEDQKAEEADDRKRGFQSRGRGFRRL